MDSGNQSINDECEQFKIILKNDIWPKISAKSDECVNFVGLKDALDQAGFKLYGYQVRMMIEELANTNKLKMQDKLNYNEFEEICVNLKIKEMAFSKNRQAITKRDKLEILEVPEKNEQDEKIYSSVHGEQRLFSEWINNNLSNDPDLEHLLPIDPEGKDLYEKIKDGILLCKLVNNACPGTIDERAIYKQDLTSQMKYDNLTLALGSAIAIGCNNENINADNLAAGQPNQVLNLLWQIFQIRSFKNINLNKYPGLVKLTNSNEEKFRKLSPEGILLRWVNYHLKRAGTQRQIEGFKSDKSYSEIYSYLMKEVAPQEAEVIIVENDVEALLKQAKKLGCLNYLMPQDIENGAEKLNLAFVANLFDKYPGLEKYDFKISTPVEETREEKTYRNWMNSMGVKPYVNWLYSDLTDGLIILQLFDIIKPHTVEWEKVKTTKPGIDMNIIEKIQNCNQAVEIGKNKNFSLEGIGGEDIANGNKKLTLAFVWQLMRLYTLSVLSQLTNTGNTDVNNVIVDWVNNKLKEVGKETKIQNFDDKSISSSKVLLALIDAMKPNSIKYELFKTSDTDEDKLENAKYAISMARKIGARVYALPEDIAEVKPKMVMTVFACLMAIDSRQNKR